MLVHGGNAKDGQSSIHLADLIAHGRGKPLRIVLRVDEQVSARIVVLSEGEINVQLRLFIEKKILARAGEAHNLNGRAFFFCAKYFADRILIRPNCFCEGVVDDGDVRSRGGIGFGKFAALDNGRARSAEIAGLNHVVKCGLSSLICRLWAGLRGKY